MKRLSVIIVLILTIGLSPQKVEAVASPVISECESGWVGGAIDYSSHKSGIGSLKLDSQHPEAYMVKSLDLHDKDIAIWVRMSEPCTANLKFHSTGGYFCYNLYVEYLNAIQNDGLWHKVVIPRGLFIYANGAVESDWANITWVKLELGSTPNTVWVDLIEMVDTPDKGLITFTFDDGNESVASVIKPMMDVYGYNGVVGITTDFIGTANHMTWQQVEALSQSGWDIASHSKTHTDLATLNTKELIREIVESKHLLRQQGYDADYFLMPYGQRVNWNSDAMAIIKDNYKLCRLAWAKYLNSASSDLYSIGVISASFNLATIKSQVDLTERTHGWLNILIHDVPSNLSANDLSELLYYINGKDVDVVVYSDLIS